MKVNRPSSDESYVAFTDLGDFEQVFFQSVTKKEEKVWFHFLANLVPVEIWETLNRNWQVYYFDCQIWQIQKSKFSSDKKAVVLEAEGRKFDLPAIFNAAYERTNIKFHTSPVQENQ